MQNNHFPQTVEEVMFDLESRIRKNVNPVNKHAKKTLSDIEEQIRQTKLAYGSMAVV